MQSAGKKSKKRQAVSKLAPGSAATPSHAALSPGDGPMATAFEILVAHIVSIYYYDVHKTAGASARAGSGPTADDYCRAAEAFLMGVKGDTECYRQISAGFHKDFTVWYPETSFAAFVDRIVGYFVPAEHFRLLANGDKDEILHNVLCELIGRICVHVTSAKILERVLDARRRADDTHRSLDHHELKNAGMLFMWTKRTDTHNQFLSRKAGGHLNDMVSGVAVERFKELLRKLAHEKAELAASLAQEKARSAALEGKLLRLVQIVRSSRAQSGKAPPREHLAEVIPTITPPGPPPPQNHLAEEVKQGAEEMAQLTHRDHLAERDGRTNPQPAQAPKQPPPRPLRPADLRPSAELQHRASAALPLEPFGEQKRKQPAPINTRGDDDRDESDRDESDRDEGDDSEKDAASLIVDKETDTEDPPVMSLTKK